VSRKSISFLSNCPTGLWLTLGQGLEKIQSQNLNFEGGPEILGLVPAKKISEATHKKNGAFKNFGF
jgi:hypothetical protein